MASVRKNLLLTTLLAIPLALVAWAVQSRLAEESRAEVGRSLTTVRDTTHLAVKTWFKDHEAAAMAWANAPVIRQAALRLLSLPDDRHTLLASPAQSQLRTWFQTLGKMTGYRGYFIVGADNVNLASSRDANVASENLLVRQPGFLPDVWKGNAAVSLPIESDVPLRDERGRLVSGLASLFVVAPIKDQRGEAIAVFMFRLDPEEGFTSILRQGRIGESGETYAFDGKGRLISQSRFDEQLHAAGLVPHGKRAILNIGLRDPGVNLIEGDVVTLPRDEQPLTVMARSAIRGGSGMNLSGYRDYRGVPVVGAWVWDADLGLGIATEIDVRESYRTLRATQLTLSVLAASTFLLLLGLSVIYTLFRQRKKAEVALRRAATVFENTNEGIMVTDRTGDIILVNKAFSTITGYEPRDVLGHNPRLHQSGRHNPAFYEQMWKTLENDGQWRGEIWNRRKTGEVYPAWENISVVRDSQGEVSNYVSIFSDISVLKESEARLEHLAHHDTLTNLPNRLRFIANLEQALEGARRHGHKVALLFLDLDEFKDINDTLGHDAGDGTLKTIAQRLKSCVRAEDTVARLAGDEFMVVLTEVNRAEDAALIAKKILAALCHPITLGAGEVRLSATIGIGIFPDDAIDCDTLVKAADTAMYHAKARGKNSFHFFSAESAQRVAGSQ